MERLNNLQLFTLEVTGYLTVCALTSKWRSIGKIHFPLQVVNNYMKQSYMN